MLVHVCEAVHPEVLKQHWIFDPKITASNPFWWYTDLVPQSFPLCAPKWLLILRCNTLPHYVTHHRPCQWNGIMFYREKVFWFWQRAWRGPWRRKLKDLFLPYYAGSASMSPLTQSFLNTPLRRKQSVGLFTKSQNNLSWLPSVQRSSSSI